MRKYAIVITALLCSLLGVDTLFAVPNTWTQKTDGGGTARLIAVGFSIGSKGYIGTGLDINSGPTKDFWEYDPAANTWTQKADFGGTARLGAVGLSIGSKGYIGTGDDGVSSGKDFWEYDPAANTWTRKADFGGIDLAYAVGFSIGSKGYIGAGLDINSGPAKDFWEYDPATNTWTQKADFGGTARLGAVGLSIGSKGYIGTGDDGVSSLKDFWEYDPAANTWTLKVDFAGIGRGYAAAFTIGSKGYVGAGWDSVAGYFNDLWEYDPTATNTWTQRTDFGGTARSDAVGFSISNKGYIGTGLDDLSFLQDFWEYDPPPCSYVLSPSADGFAPASAPGSVTVTPSLLSSCSWTAVSNDPWISIISGNSVVGSGSVAYQISGNTSGIHRKGTMTIGGQPVTIRQAKSAFLDDPNNVFSPYIYGIYTEGITVGCGTDIYCPSNGVTRGEMAAFIIRAKFGESFVYTNTPYFTDVPSGNVFYKYVQKLKDEGITVTTGTYMVDNIVSREQMAAFIIRAKYGETFTYTGTPYYTDVPSTSAFFKYVQRLKDDATTATTGAYNASGNVTRDQMAAFLGRAFLGMR